MSLDECILDPNSPCSNAFDEFETEKAKMKSWSKGIVPENENRWNDLILDDRLGLSRILVDQDYMQSHEIWVSSQMLFFCGYTMECIHGSNYYKYSKAIENVQKYYSVIGVLEEMEKTLNVFENFLPRYFKSSVKLFGQDKEKRNSNRFKQIISTQARKILQRQLYYEIQFYEFVKFRLLSQYQTLNL